MPLKISIARLETGQKANCKLGKNHSVYMELRFNVETAWAWKGHVQYRLINILYAISIPFSRSYFRTDPCRGVLQFLSKFKKKWPLAC